MIHLIFTGIVKKKKKKVVKSLNYHSLFISASLFKVFIQYHSSVFTELVVHLV